MASPQARAQDASPTTGAAPSATSATSRLNPTGRTEAFSDGVFAIAITLLVLEVRVPSEHDVQAAGSLARALLHAWPSYLSYLATFLTVGVIWLNHHGVFAKIAYIDRSLQWWNLTLLLSVSFTPFPNALVAEFLREDQWGEPARTATAVYALVFALSTIPWVFMWAHVAAHTRLLEAPWTQRYARTEVRRSVVGVVIYTVGIGVAVLAPLVAVVLFIASAVFYALTAEGSRPGTETARDGNSASRG